MKILMQLKDVPDGTIITKLRGMKEYIVKRVLKVYSEEGGTPIQIDEDCIFMIATDDNGDKWVVAHLEAEIVSQMIEEGEFI